MVYKVITLRITIHFNYFVFFIYCIKNYKYVIYNQIDFSI